MPRKNPQDARALAAIAVVASEQEGVITSGQALATGISPGAIRRHVESGRWQRLHRGVFHVRSGEPSLRGRMWAAHLALGPGSVVAGVAAAHYWGLLDGDPARSQPILMLVEERSHLRTPGVRTRRVRDPGGLAHAVRCPPVVTVEHAVVDLAGRAMTDAIAVETVLRACRLRLTTPDRLRAVIDQQARLRRRSLLTSLCTEARVGVTSPLELRYVTGVARAHGLPPGQHQVRATSFTGGTAYRDVVYREQGVLIELDGRLGHEDESAVFRDQFRDNDAALSGLATLRFGWLAVVGGRCQVAIQVERILQRGGWTGNAQPCNTGCPVWAQQPGAVVPFYRQNGTRLLRGASDRRGA